MNSTAVKSAVYQYKEATQPEEQTGSSNINSIVRHQPFVPVDALPDMVWLIDLDYKFTYISPSVERMLGYTSEEALALPLRTLYMTASAENLIKKLEEHINELYINSNAKDTFTIEVEHAAKNGSSCWTETSIRLLRKGAHAEGFIGVARDITERRRLEQVANQRQLLTMAAQMTEEIAREINNPLGGILLSTEQMLLNNKSAAVRGDLEVIHREAKRAAKLISSLLNAANMSPQKMERCHLGRLLNKVLEIRKYSHTSQNINSITNLCKPGAFVFCDTEQIQRVFMSLIMSAEESLRRQNGGNIIITSRKQGRWVKVTIADDGMPDSIEDYFIPFGKLLMTGNEPYSDLTPGQCHSIITYHGGIISTERNKMGGTSFIIEMPLA